MRIETRLCPVLSCLAPGADGPMDLAEGTTVEEAVRSLGIPPGSHWVAFVNGRLGEIGTPLAEGDRLYVFAPVSGG